jgi:hypothetical protein
MLGATITMTNEISNIFLSHPDKIPSSIRKPMMDGRLPVTFFKGY